MFTGIIEGIGILSSIKSAGKGKRITVTADFDLSQSKIGDSIAVNGACLTAVEIAGRRFSADVSPETLDKTTFARARIGDKMNLERAMRLSDRLDGHIVSGHIDGVGTIENKKTIGNALIVSFNAPESLSRYMIRKGSVAVDGISLTINECSEGKFEVSIIPHTAALTTIGFKNPGDMVNIETDMIGKYVERLLGGNSDFKKSEISNGIDMQFLATTGFL